MAERVEQIGLHLEALKHEWRGIPLLRDAASRARSASRNSRTMELFALGMHGEGDKLRPINYATVTRHGAIPFQTFRLRYDLPPIEDSIPGIAEQLQATINMRDGEVTPRLGILLGEEGNSDAAMSFLVELDSVKTSRGGHVLKLASTVQMFPEHVIKYLNHRAQSIGSVPVPDFPAEFVGWNYPTRQAQGVLLKPRPQS